MSPPILSSQVLLLVFSLLISTAFALKFDQQYFGYNLNQNVTATEVLDYSGIWDQHVFFPSPSNWRMPFYTLFLDKFVDGDPTNNDINGTMFEHDVLQTQLRHGGDLQGLMDSLDYIQGMGIEAIYIAGTPFLNQPWGADGYSPLDLSLLDQHFGDIQTWRNAITEIHSRGMYVMLDNTVATLGDLIGFKDFLNTSVPFDTKEHQVQYRDPQRQYSDFDFGNNYQAKCNYPRFWLETGFPVGMDVTSQLNGCYDSEFDQYGDFEGIGDFEGWKRSLSKAAGVQDRLREWVPSVLEKIEHFSCLTIMMLDIDGFRIDKATQVTVDAMGHFSRAMRDCAAKVGKNNFFITGEISGGNTYGSVFIGRGRQPDMALQSQLEAVTMTNTSNSSVFIRDVDENGLDSAGFHYSIYRSLVRLLGMDGIIAGLFDTPVNLADAWDEILRTNDLVNPSTGVFDPRHMFGTTNQDNFRWPAVAHGTEKMLLGQFLTTLYMPGIPLLLWGEEQNFYVLDNTASNYIFGRQAMSSAQAWEMHGCYTVGSSQYNNFVVDGSPAKTGCTDSWNSLDHRDPSSPIRNIIKTMYQMRKNFPVLNDGWVLKQLSNQTHQIFLPASNGTATEIGIWSAMRGNFDNVQDLSATGAGNQTVWLVYSNDNHTVDYTFNCSDTNEAFISPFSSNTTVKNLFYPHDEINLTPGPVNLGIDGSNELNGCVGNMTMGAWEFRAYVPIQEFKAPGPMITKFLPGHDTRLLSTAAVGQQSVVPIEIHFSEAMNCSGTASSIAIQSTTEDGKVANIDQNSIVCATVPPNLVAPWVGGLPTTWTMKANLVNVSDGIHVLTLKNVASQIPTISTGAVDHFFLRIGHSDNPVAFPQSANYSSNILHKGADGKLLLSHKAAGADRFRYSLNWGSTYSEWQQYSGGNTTLDSVQWSGTKAQNWEGEHVIVQYHSSALGSSDHVQHGDLDWTRSPRRFPHLFVQGEFNAFGTDSGVDAAMVLTNNSNWNYDLLAEWPTYLQINEWGINPDGQADQSAVFGDIDGDNVMDRLPPSSLTAATVNFDSTPAAPFLSWRLSFNDATFVYSITPSGNRWNQLIVYILMWTVPLITASLGVWAYLQSFYQVKFNKTGIPMKNILNSNKMFRKVLGRKRGSSKASSIKPLLLNGEHMENTSSVSLTPGLPAVLEGRRRVLIATMEYDIEDWAIKIKIGGLGVMAQLMGKNLSHQDLIWVVPCVGGIDYPTDEPADPMDITILGKSYIITVQYHVLRNITYVLLDAPIFRAQSKSEPYPARMDDIDSAIYYSAWNQCIALTIKRFTPDLYHINDYHGALAPIHLLPETIPCALSLHNAEFQGLWGMRTPEESKEVCEVYNISPEVAQKYVQFGDVFNLLHAGSSYLRMHQKGFGAVGVSKKYGTRAWARYPIFWGLHKIGQLPNPDPSDLSEWNADEEQGELEIDQEFEAARPGLRKQAQEWAGLKVDPDAELLVFVGRWSMQKGVDLIADVIPALLDENEKVQLICIGPVIDLYGKFAALKLDILMKQYPGRVFSKPEFTALPPFIFSGAEFALIPSRDEPFGLVAVEFGRKGALGIGARVGGLGQMPGWWFTVESTSTAHMHQQFKRAIKDALSSKRETRVEMRARSAKQRFPVAQWVADLETLQSTAINIHHKEADPKGSRSRSPNLRGRGRSHRPTVSLTADISRDKNSSVRPSSTGPGHQRSSSQGDDPRRATISSIEPARPGRTFSPNLNARRQTSTVDSSILLNKTTRARSPLATGISVSEEEESSNEFNWYSPNGSPDPSTRSRAVSDIGTFTPATRNRSSSQLSLAPTLNGRHSRTPSISYSQFGDGNEAVANELLLQPSNLYQMQNISNLSLETVVGNKQSLSLQKVELSFTDSTEEYFNDFKAKLSKLDASNSEDALCIEEYLVKSEKAWFTRYGEAKLGKISKEFRRSYGDSKQGKKAKEIKKSLVISSSRPVSPYRDSYRNAEGTEDSDTDHGIMMHNFGSDEDDEFQLGYSYDAPRGLRKHLQIKIGDWPLYTLILAMGQIMAANSYQITLLTGPGGSQIEKFYVIAGIYIFASVIWWLCYRRLKAVVVLTIPFVLYSLSFLFLGIVPFIPGGAGSQIVTWLQNSATGLYTIASASGSLYFALNFGDEGGSPVKYWVYRACIVQGTQQIYIAALWYWGTHLASPSQSLSKTTAAVLLPISAILGFLAFVLARGLPMYYRQTPGKVSSFYVSLFRRNIILWFLFTVLIQNFFLSTLAGRNWSYLWSSRVAAAYQVALLTIFFFIVVWIATLWLFGRLAMTHTWILPIFAIGLGAPRWVQILWSCTPISSFLPWAGTPLASALLGRALWLWLGLLDALQGVGFGIILLQTLTRLHISATLIGAQILGASVTILAKAVGPSQMGPGDVFPNLLLGAMTLTKPWFIVGLVAQLVLCAGFFKFFRKEQLSKP